EADPKIAEWYQSTAKKAKNTALNYSRLLSLYWQSNKRFRSFKNTSQWLTEVNEQQNSPDITVRRAWGKEFEAFNLSYKGKAGTFASKKREQPKSNCSRLFQIPHWRTRGLQLHLGHRGPTQGRSMAKKSRTLPAE